MITIDDIFDRVLLRSGQFILKTNNVEIDIDNFRLLVEDCLEIYNYASPYDMEDTVDFRGTRIFTFPQNYGVLNRPPSWIAEAHPIGGIGSSRFNGHGSNGHTLSLIHISEPTRPERISYAVFCLKKKK